MPSHIAPHPDCQAHPTIRTKQIAVRYYPSEYEQLRAASIRTGRPIADLIRGAVTAAGYITAEDDQ